MKLEVGMYCRYKSTIIKYDPIKINKIIQIINTDNLIIYHLDNKDVLFEKDIIKASYNIIDLIKKNDIILGRDGKIYQVWKVDLGYVFTNTRNKEGLFVTLVDYQIDKILTKEQFENNCYKIGD